MTIMNKLFAIYEGAGFEISTGLNPARFDDYKGAPFTWLLKDRENFTEGLGISMKEVYFLECLFDGYAPQNIFIIGNSFGWSTLAVGLLNPTANVIAIDSGMDENSLAGIEFTNRVAAEVGLNVRVVEGTSPQDVGRVIDEHLGGNVDFCFVDGMHTNDQVVKDYRAVAPHLSDDGMILFHDVLSLELGDGMAAIAADAGTAPLPLHATCSGMTVLYRGDNANARRTIETFAGNERGMEMMSELRRREKHRAYFRMRNSINKRIASIKRIFS